jgi:5'-nucleotidase
LPFELENKLVVGVASSALFDLQESDAVFRDQGEAKYREYQEENLEETLRPGVAFPFIKRLLSLNDLASEDQALVEVIVLSRNDPETGLRVLRSITDHGLPITRAIFMQGRSPYKFIEALNISLFLSANERDVREALEMGFAAGRVLGAPIADSTGADLRIAFDFDGVLADDSSERVMQAEGLKAFHANETQNVEVPLPEGMLTDFLRAINRVQDVEEAMAEQNPDYNRRVHVAIVTARNAPSHERVVRTLKAWGLRVNDAFFLGGVEKARILRVLQPHIFFDDQMGHLESAAGEIPSVHVPFGVTNEGHSRTVVVTAPQKAASV